MKRTISTLLFIFFLFNLIFAQKPMFIFHGYVEDSNSGERIGGATIYCKASKYITHTNSYGFFTVYLNQSNDKILISKQGYHFEEHDVSSLSDKALTIELNAIENYEVASDKQLYDTIIYEDVSQISPNQARKIPILMGETDYIKAYELLPGIQQKSQGSTGIVVRGGDPDQNLILTDGIPVYNTGHIYGLISSINTDAVAEYNVYKGTFSSRYGGRTSSVFDIRMKDGNFEKFKGTTSIGILSAKVMLEGPIIKDKTSFMICGKRGFLDLLAMAIQNSEDLSYFQFYDYTLKLTHKLNDKNQINLSFNNSQDKLYYSTKGSSDDIYSEKWGNNTTLIRWNYIPNKKLFCNTTFFYNSYAIKRNISQVYYDFDNDYSSFSDYESGVYDYGSMINFDYQLNNKHKLSFGGLSIIHIIKNGTEYNVNYGEESIPITKQPYLTKYYNDEIAFFIEDEWNISNQWRFIMGFRNSFYNSKNKLYYFFEPRITLNYTPNEKRNFVIAYSRTSQNMHLLDNSISDYADDLWFAVTDNIAPTEFNHVTFSFNQKLGANYILISEMFYRKMNNVPIPPSHMTELKGNWQSTILQGQGKAYGLEITLKKETGKLNGWIDYTLSKSDRTFSEINMGKAFPDRYNRLHSIKVFLTYSFNRKIDVACNWFFNSGIDYRLNLYNNYNSDSNYGLLGYSSYADNEIYVKLPDYQRFDLSLNLHRKLTYFQRTINITLFNFIGTRRALAYDVDGDESSFSRGLYLIPSINYILSF